MIANAGGSDLTQAYARAVSGGVTLDGSVYWNSNSVECGQGASFTVLETDDALDPARHKLSTMAVQCDAASSGRSDPLRVPDISPATETRRVQYGPACGATDHTIVYGPLSAVSSYGYSGQQCGIGVTPQALFTPGPGSWFFLIVGNDGVAIAGSYGRDSQGNQRPQDLNDPVCTLLQSLLLPCN